MKCKLVLSYIQVEDNDQILALQTLITYETA